MQTVYFQAKHFYASHTLPAAHKLSGLFVTSHEQRFAHLARVHRPVPEKYYLSQFLNYSHLLGAGAIPARLWLEMANVEHDFTEIGFAFKNILAASASLLKTKPKTYTGHEWVLWFHAFFYDYEGP